LPYNSLDVGTDSLIKKIHVGSGSGTPFRSDPEPEKKSFLIYNTDIRAEFQEAETRTSIYTFSVDTGTRQQCCGRCGFGIRCLFDSWILAPGWVKNPGSRSGMNNPDHIPSA
jgi:hypothetical protein